QNGSPFPTHRQCHPAGTGQGGRGPSAPPPPPPPPGRRGSPPRPRSPAHPAAARTVVNNRLICCSFSLPFQELPNTVKRSGYNPDLPPLLSRKKKKKKYFQEIYPKL
ncbi:unnamed protein product, partial [Bubo scandiacus]